MLMIKIRVGVLRNILHVLHRELILNNDRYNRKSNYEIITVWKQK